MDTKPTVPRHRAVSFAYDQAKVLGVDWRFPCNPDMEDLCDRAEYAGAVPVVVLLPADQALAVFDGRASVRFAPE